MLEGALAHQFTRRYRRVLPRIHGGRGTSADGGANVSGWLRPRCCHRNLRQLVQLLACIDLLGEREAAVVDSFGDTLRAIQLESITKSYKLITIRSLLHEGALRTGDDVSNNAAVSRQLLLADPRLAREVPLKEFPTSPRPRKTNGSITGVSGRSPTSPARDPMEHGPQTCFGSMATASCPPLWSTMFWATPSTQWPPNSSSIDSLVTYSTKRSRRLVRGRADCHTQMGIQSSDSIDDNHPTYQLAMSTSSRTEQITAPRSRKAPFRSPPVRIPRAMPYQGCFVVGLAHRPVTRDDTRGQVRAGRRHAAPSARSFS